MTQPGLRRVAGVTGLAGLAGIVAALPAPAQELLSAAPGSVVTPALAPVMDKGDVAWMMTATTLVLFMLVPGLALFYGGLVRSKNMLSVLMHCTVIGALAMVIWVAYGYSIAFGGGSSPFWGGLGKVFLRGITPDSLSPTFSAGYVIPEFLFVAFQMTFAAIAPALIVGAFAERIRFSALLVFCALWVTLVYLPVAHMVWDPAGLIFGWGALDFAGGTVVHINAGVAALVGAIVVGPRLGYGRDMMAPHSMTLTLVGAGMLWVGWFGFNVGSTLEANGVAALALLNTFTATAGAILAWAALEAVLRGKASLLGAASGMISGLVAVTPAAGTVGPVGALLLGAITAAACYFFVAVVKNRFGYDDSLDVFGIHGVGGIVGALGTAVFSTAALGGIKGADYAMAAQLWVQFKAVGLTVIWSGAASFALYRLVDRLIGLRVDRDSERQGLDLSSHGESAYHL